MIGADADVNGSDGAVEVEPVEGDVLLNPGGQLAGTDAWHDEVDRLP